jgi:hypothetical protein
MWRPNLKESITVLEDRFYDYVLVIICPSCKHERRADPQVLARLVGGTTRIVDVMARMRCSECNTLGAVWDIERKPVDRSRGRWH